MAFYQRDEDDEFDRVSHSFSPAVMRTIVGVSAGILVILLVVFAVNYENRKADKYRKPGSAVPSASPGSSANDLTAGFEYDRSGKDVEELYRDGELRAEDLDIWDMYDDGAEVHVVHDTPQEVSEDPDHLGPYELPPANDPVSDADGENPEGTPDPDATPSPSPEGTERLIDGVKLNTLDHTALRLVNDKMTYLVNGEESSYLGVDISAENGNVNFVTLKENGVKFVMLRVGSRGYDSGVITLDPNYERNIKAATDAGLDIGLSFSSRAISIDEAVEEAFFCMQNSEGYKISYPIAYVFDGDLLDSSRTDNLDVKARTKVAEAFMNTIRSNGFNTILYGTKDYILKDLAPENLLPQYDVWLFDTNNIPDYPYQFKMWRYSNSVTIPGIEQRGSYDVSFVDYAGR